MGREREVQKERDLKRKRRVINDKCLRLKDSLGREMYTGRRKGRALCGPFVLPSLHGHVERLARCSNQTTSRPIPSHPSEPGSDKGYASHIVCSQDRGKRRERNSAGLGRRAKEAGRKKTEKRWRKKSKSFINKEWFGG